MPRRSRRRRATTGSLGSFLVLLTLLAAVYACNQLKLVDLSAFGLPGGAPAATPVPAGPVTGQWYRLYFTSPAQTASATSGGIPDEVAASIDAATQSVDVAVYEFDLPRLAQALIRAQQRGLAVRLVTDTDTLGEETIQSLKAAGVPVVDDGRQAIMHDKFVVLDRAQVWTGSMNFTRNDAYRNNNSFMLIQSPRLAANYTREFEEMFASRQFGPNSPANTPYPVIDLQGTRLETLFSPDDGVARRLLQVLEGAQRSIDFMAFAFTRQDFAEALLARSDAGVRVRGVFETRQIAAGADQAWVLLTQGGLASNVRQDGNPYMLHSKVFIVDEAIVVMGSYNFSRNAEERNDENVLIIHNPEIAAAYLQEWQRVWDVAGP